MKILINKRKLSDKDINLLNKEIKKFPNPVFLTNKHWQELKTAYVAEIDGNIAGICSVNKFKNWYKLGPFVVFERYHGKGIGKKILKKIVDENRYKNLFIGSRNNIVWNIVESLGFKEEPNFFMLPMEIKSYLLRSLLWCLDIDFMKELIRKKSTNQGPFRFYLRKGI